MAARVVSLALLVCFVLHANAVSLVQKVERLNDAVSKRPHLIRLDSKSFATFTEAPRNYSIIVVMTATEPSQACDLCQRFGPEFENVAESWYSLKKPSRLYFATLEYRAGQEVFSKMKITTAPQVLHYPPTEGKFAKAESQRDPNKFEAYDLQRGAEAEEFVKFVEQIVGHEVPTIKHIDYSKYLIAIIAIAASAAVARLAWDRFGEVLRQPLLWSVLAMGFTLFFISGHAWNSIRGAPFTGGRETISPNFQSQFGVETRLVATLYGAAAVSFIMLTIHVPTISTPTVQRAFAWGYSAAFLVSCSAIIAVFRIKYGSYPFRLLF